MKLDEFMDANSIPNTAMAEKLGVDESYISHLRSGRRTPSLKIASKIESTTDGKVRVTSWADQDAA